MEPQPIQFQRAAADAHKDNFPALADPTPGLLHGGFRGGRINHRVKKRVLCELCCLFCKMFIQWVQCQKPEPFGRESPPARICVRQEHARPIGLSVQSAAYPDRSRAGYKHAVAGRQFQLGRGMGADGQRLQHGDLLRGRWPVCFQPVLSRCGKVLL